MELYVKEYTDCRLNLAPDDIGFQKTAFQTRFSCGKEDMLLIVNLLLKIQLTAGLL